MTTTTTAWTLWVMGSPVTSWRELNWNEEDCSKVPKSCTQLSSFQQYPTALHTYNPEIYPEPTYAIGLSSQLQPRAVSPRIDTPPLNKDKDTKHRLVHPKNAGALKAGDRNIQLWPSMVLFSHFSQIFCTILTINFQFFWTFRQHYTNLIISNSRMWSDSLLWSQWARHEVNVVHLNPKL